MPVNCYLTGLVIGFIGGYTISPLGQYIADSINTTDFMIKRSVKRAMTTNDPINLDESSIIQCDELIDKMMRKIKSSAFGLFVFAAPSGSGKTTVIKMLVNKIKRDHIVKYIKDGNEVLEKRDIKELLKVPHRRSLSDYIPNNSVIILDQIDYPFNLSNDIRSYLISLAVDSSNWKQYKVIVCVSDFNIAKSILKCNGYEKISRLCQYSDLQWSDEQLEKLIDLKLRNLAHDDRIKIIKLAATCHNSPGLIKRAFECLEETNGDPLLGYHWTSLEDYSEHYRLSWEQFLSD